MKVVMLVIEAGEDKQVKLSFSNLTREDANKLEQVYADMFEELCKQMIDGLALQGQIEIEKMDIVK